MQIFNPAECKVHISGMLFSAFPATIHFLEHCSGAEPGTAVISWPQKYATPQMTKFGDGMYITLGGEIVFRGIIAGVPITIDSNTDIVELHCVDDKWLMSRNIIGQIGIGTVAGGAGFPDVGYDVVFNRDGRPDKDPSKDDFNLGSTAVFWSFKSMLSFIFTNYVDTTVATLATARLGAAYARKALNVNLVGQTAAQAIDTIVEKAGESWGLMPTAKVSEFVPMRPGGWGHKQAVTLNSPKGRQTIVGAGIRHASSVQINANIQSVRDQVQVVSGNEVRECTISSAAALASPTPLLVKDASFVSPDFIVRYSVNVLAYAANDLGCNLSAGARPKPWLPSLNTRLNAAGNDYLTAAQLAATPGLQVNERARIAIWVATDGNVNHAKLITRGAYVDHAKATISLPAKVGVFDATASDKTVALDISGSLATLAIWVTCATVLETFEQSVTAIANTYLPKPFTQLVRKDDIIPETRQDCSLPDLTTGEMTVTVGIEDGLEKYLDIAAQLTEIRDSVALLAPKVANDLTIGFDFIPILFIGDLLEINGRDIGQSGQEVVTNVTYDVHAAYHTTVKATDVVAGAGGAKPERRSVGINLGRIPQHLAGGAMGIKREQWKFA